MQKSTLAINIEPLISSATLNNLPCVPSIVNTSEPLPKIAREAVDDPTLELIIIEPVKAFDPVVAKLPDMDSMEVKLFSLVVVRVEKLDEAVVNELAVTSFLVIRVEKLDEAIVNTLDVKALLVILPANEPLRILVS